MEAIRASVRRLVSRSSRSLSERSWRSEYLPSSSFHSLNRSFETSRTASIRSLTALARSSLRSSSAFSLVYLSSSEPPSDLDDRLEPLQRRLELLLRLGLRRARRLDAADEDVALLLAELLHGPVVDRVAADREGRHGGDDEQRPATTRERRRHADSLTAAGATRQRRAPDDRAAGASRYRAAGSGISGRTETRSAVGKSAGIGAVTGRPASHCSARTATVCRPAQRIRAGCVSPAQTWPKVDV